MESPITSSASAPSAFAISSAVDPRDHWTARGQPWRTQPEIDDARQRQLRERLAAPVNIEQGEYPFAGMALTRADVEWLLATHDDGRGPVIWADEPIRATGWGVKLDGVRWGLDLRGALLAGADLSGLPLARTRCNLTDSELFNLPFASQKPAAAKAGADLKRVDLRGAHLEGAVFYSCALDDAELRGVYVERATFSKATAARTDWREARFDLTDLTLASLEGAQFAATDLRTSGLYGAKFSGADLSGVNMAGGKYDMTSFREVNLMGVQAAGANFSSATFVGVNLRNADLSGANLKGARLFPVLDWSYVAQAQQTMTNDLTDANLRDANLDGATLTGVTLDGARLDGANLAEAHLEGASLVGASLVGADLRRATFDSEANLQGVTFGDRKRAATFFGVAWNDADLSAVDWSRLTRLGDEAAIPAPKTPADRPATLAALTLTVRAYRQHALTLRGQGLNRQAAPFDYRGQVLQRKLLWLRMRWEGKINLFGAWLFSAFLGGLTGYGYRMWRVLLVYALVILGCAAAYYALGAQVGPHLSPSDALLVSVTAFHGRVFSEQFGPGSPQLWVTAIEAIAGLIVEGVFIAMLTQRFFDR